MTIRDLGDQIIWAGAVAAALSALGFLIYRVFVKPGVRWLRDQIVETRGQVEAARVTAEAVHSQVFPNHGHSMKDQLTRLEQKLDQLDQRITDHLINHPGS